MKAHPARSALLLVVVLTVSLALGDPVGPGWPPPGGADWAGSGESPGHTGGLVWQYSNLDPVGGGLADLWWGTSANSMRISLDNGENYSGAEILVFSATHSTSTTAYWTGYSHLTWYHRTQGRRTDQISVRFSIALTGGATWVDPGSTGVTGHSGTIAVVTGDFVAILLAEGYMPSSPNGDWAWQPINVGFDSVSTEGGTGISFSTGFWWQFPPGFGDLDGDYDVDLDDHALFAGCMDGPGVAYPTSSCERGDLDDGDVDLGDFAEFQNVFGTTG